MNKNIKLLFIACANLLTGMVYAQVGINTNNPEAVLDINGKVRMTDEFVLGGTDTSTGFVGNQGHAIVSQGEGLSPIWKDVRLGVPDLGDYFLKGSIAKTDTRGGLLLDDYYVGIQSYTQDQVMTNMSDWAEFKDFKLDLPVSANPMSVVINFQAVFQTSYQNLAGKGMGWQSFNVAIMQDVKNANGVVTSQIIKGVRSGIVSGVDRPQLLFTMTLTLNDLPANKATTLRIYAAWRNIDVNSKNELPHHFVVGRDVPGATTNLSMFNRASMRADIFEKIK